VAGDEHGDAGRRGLADDGVEVVAASGVEAGMGLVEQPQLGAADDEAGEGGAPLLACRKPPYRDGGEAPEEAEAFEGGRALLLGSANGRSPEGDVLRHREVEVEAVAVSEHADERAHALSLGGEVAAEHRAPPAGEGHETGTQAQQRRLAGAVGTTQPHDLAAIDRQRHAGDGGKATEHGDGTVEVDHHCRATLAPYPVASMGRTSRWDRPRAPRDLRWFVRLFGKTLIVIGLLMFGFVAYQLWGTGIEYARAQDRAEREFEELMAAASQAPTTALATTSTLTPTTSPLGAGTSSVAGSTSSTVASTTSTTASTTSTTATTTTVAAFDVASLNITDGGALAWLRIPSIGLDDIVVAGVGREELKKGPGHYPQTPMPGQLGNSAIAGHRTTYGGPFLHVDELDPGDEILVTTPYGEFVYLVTGTEIVDADNWEVIATTDPTVASLTLTSCHPIGTASQRIVVHAALDLTRSDTPGPAVFNYGRDAVANATGELPGENVVDTATSTTTSTIASTTTSTVAAEAGTESSSTTSTSTTTSTTPPPQTFPADTLYSVLPGGGTIGGDDDGREGEAAEDAFSNHWFTDSAAWPHVALWGALATGVVVGAYQLAKRFRNSWIGLAAGAVPFLVALYFFYQNVNRLLPAAL
jgi:sortase A